MATFLGALRRCALAPSMASVTFAARGYPAPDGPMSERLQAVPQAVVAGFEAAIEGPSLWEAERRLALLKTDLRGFGYEGAAMAYTILDQAALRRGSRASDLLAGPGAQHIFLTYIGIGFAMARLPRRMWQHVVPDLTGSPYYPTLSWFAVDGYGFDRAYFDTRRWVDQQRRPRAYPWDGYSDYFLRACDQGVGRALWFIHGGVPNVVSAAVREFAPHRQGDLFSGVGLAAAFAGGCDAAGYSGLRDAAKEHRAYVGLGAVLAAKGRRYASYVPNYTSDAVEGLTGLSIEVAADLADRTAVAYDTTGQEPSYERWRARIRSALVG